MRAKRSAVGEPVATPFQRQPAQRTGLSPVAVTGPVAAPVLVLVAVSVPVLQLALVPQPAGTGSAPARSAGPVAGTRRELVRWIAAVPGFVPDLDPDPLPEIGAASQPALAPSSAAGLDSALDSALDSVAGIEAAATDSG